MSGPICRPQPYEGASATAFTTARGKSFDPAFGFRDRGVIDDISHLGG
ncbi:MAG: hypothetical protein ACR2LI_06240 [Propionibacteriaceae bacterium]